MGTRYRATLAEQERPAWWLAVALVVAAALAMRIWFITAGTVGDPMVGDATQYCDYAWNLARHLTFSMAPPGSETIVPDSYRDPGYPLFLAGLLVFWGSGEAWYHMILFAQAVLGALSAGMAALIARRWLSRRAALVIGMAVALWPHNVSISGFLLSESLFGFMSLLAAWQFCLALESTARLRWLLAGFSFGAAALVNATLTPFAPILVILLAFRRAAPRRLLLAMLLGSLLLPGAWALRGFALPPSESSSGRAMINLVQGSWPDYHSAYNLSFFGDAQQREKAQKTMQAIGQEQQLAVKSPAAGLSAMFGRFQQEPIRYLAWYAWKPELLWAWDIRMGRGDVYPYHILHPIYVSNAAMRVFESICVGINPLLFALMMVAVVLTLVRSGQSQIASGLYAVALLVAYETAVYSILQSEPRYSIPFRPFEMMLAVTAACWLWRTWQVRKANVTDSSQVQTVLPSAP